MSLLFGKLTASFVSFGQATVDARKAGATPEIIQAFEDARNHFRTEAAKDASYLVYIGIGMFITTYGYMLIWVWSLSLSWAGPVIYINWIDLYRRDQFAAYPGTVPQGSTASGCRIL